MTHVRRQEEYTYHISKFDVLKGRHELVDQIFIRDEELLLALTEPFYLEVAYFTVRGSTLPKRGGISEGE